MAGSRGGGDGPGGGDPDDEPGDAEYVFAVRLQLSPSGGDVRVEPPTADVRLLKEAAPPGEDDWLFFRDNLWRGEVNDHDHLCGQAEETLGTPVHSIEFRELRTDQRYLEALKAAIGADLELFRADDVGEVLNKYLGSRVHVRERDERG